MTKILKVNPINPEKSAIKEAADVIRGGGTVAFPTETVYGIGADAFNGKACAEIFRIKNRPQDNPLIVHISRLDQLKEVTESTTSRFMEIAKILWPGPITFILKKSKKIPNEVSCGLETVAIRMPAHPVALRLIEESGTPIAAPSANLSKKPSATRIDHVIKDLDGKVDMILDGGDTAFGVESTIIDMTQTPPVLLRPGAFTVEELEKYLGSIKIPELLNNQMQGSEIPKAPGMKYRHYAPETVLIAVNNEEIFAEIPDLMPKNKKFAFLCSNELADKIKNKKFVIKMGSRRNLYEITKNLFDCFRRLDHMDVDVAFIETFPERGIGLALMNRILKASGFDSINSVRELKRYL